MDIDRIAIMADMFRLLGDPTRLRIVLACLDEPLPVAAIAERAGVSQPLASHHLRLLKAGRILRGTREARQVIYTAADDHVRLVLHNVMTHADEGLPA